MVLQPRRASLLYWMFTYVFHLLCFSPVPWLGVLCIIVDCPVWAVCFVSLVYLYITDVLYIFLLNLLLYIFFLLLIYLLFPPPSPILYNLSFIILHGKSGSYIHLGGE